ncbi:hypothetical protein [Mycolicibacterium septicum]|uniref:hypothetical protein n=1 Tax=Mycolicibacterium septicum TaxID=98668 RepID=UPI001AFC407F|nr:hypothetical protein [Mycolicibacterium septicum]QRY53789.1 hypothetical protein JVX95_10945 [Mycolicibacterium septicum]
MSKESSGAGLLAALPLGVPVYALYTFCSYRWRAVHPGRRDPGVWMLPIAIAGWLAVLTAVVVANAVAFDFYGGDALFPAICLDIVAAIGLVALAVFLWEYIESRRRRSGYVITVVNYMHAPRQVHTSMRRIYSSARSMRRGRAYQDGMFGDIELDELVYSAAEGAVLSSELNDVIRGLKNGSAEKDRDTVAQAKRELVQIRKHLEEVEAAIARAAKQAGQLSGRLPAPEPTLPARSQPRTPQRPQGEPSAAERRAAARRKADDVAARLVSYDKVDAVDVEERVDAISAGYDEVQAITENVLRGPQLPQPEPPAGTAPAADEGLGTGRAARAVTLRVAKMTARGVTKGVVAGAKFGVEKAKQRADSGE